MQVICCDWGKVLSPLFLLQIHFMLGLCLSLGIFVVICIAGLGLVILISGLFGGSVSNSINFSASMEVHVSGLHLLFGLVS